MRAGSQVANVGVRVMTVGMVIKTTHRRNLLGTVITMPTVITLLPTLDVTHVVWIMAARLNAAI